MTEMVAPPRQTEVDPKEAFFMREWVMNRIRWNAAHCKTVSEAEGVAHFMRGHRRHMTPAAVQAAEGAVTFAAVMHAVQTV